MQLGINRTEILSIVLLLVVALFIAPSVHAQTTAITLQTPTYAVLGSNGVVHIPVTALVSFTGYSGGGNPMAPAEAMNVVVFYHNNYTAPVMGTVTSSPDACNTLIEQPAFFGYAMCPITPSSGSGTETVAFTLTIFNAEMQQYHFDLNAGMISLSGSTNSEVSGSISKSDFYVTVTNQQPTFTITIAAPPPVAVTIDGSVQTPGPVTVTESPGLHTISVPQTIPVTNGMKLDFSHWSDGSYQAARSIDIEDDTTLTPSYVSQYLLTLTDPAATGSGWYTQGTTAQISAPSSEPMQGILGLLGGSQTFQGWYQNGVLVSTNNDASITMNSPQSIDTQWSANYSMPIGIILLVLIVASAALFFAFGRKLIPSPTSEPNPRKESKKKTETVASVSKQSESKSETHKDRMKPTMYCKECGAKIPRESKFCLECGKATS